VNGAIDSLSENRPSVCCAAASGNEAHYRIFIESELQSLLHTRNARDLVGGHRLCGTWRLDSGGCAKKLRPLVLFTGVPPQLLSWMKGTTINLSHRSLSAFDLSQLLEQWKGQLGRNSPGFTSGSGGSSSSSSSSGSSGSPYGSGYWECGVQLGFNKLGNDGAKIIAEFMTSNPAVTCLDLCFNSIGKEGAYWLAQSLLINHTLKTLFLPGNVIGAKGFMCLAKALSRNRTLTSLNLTGNSGLPEGAQYLASELKSNAVLTTLSLNGNKLEAAGIVHISKLFTSLMCNISYLRIGDNNITDAGLDAFSSALLTYRKLRLIQLSFNEITRVGMEPLAKSLTGYTTLETLELDNNKIGDDGVRMLVEILPTMNLSSLNVGFNSVGTDGVSLLFRALTPNKSMTHLVVSGSTISAESAARISAMLKQDEVLVELYLDRVAISPAGENNIAAGIAHNQNCPLVVLSGFHLGTALSRLGSPAEFTSMSNEKALEFLRSSWAQRKSQLAPLIRTSSFGKGVAEGLPPAGPSSGNTMTAAGNGLYGNGIQMPNIQTVSCVLYLLPCG
jgi:Ran GTPase-activating protein (RanGAP) involved in mRNA processing and transport